ncbi:MAG: M48 family metalloprotease [Thermodesulfobacteriota bacterium]
MFGNFLYFIVALLIYTTYQPTAAPRLPIFQAFFFFLGIAALFVGMTWLLFNRLKDRIERDDYQRIDREYNTIVTRQSIMAIVIFAIDVYGLDLGGYFNDVYIFNLMPTLEALLFLSLFVLYLSAVWACSYTIQEKLYRTGISRWRYVFSNISFSVPVLLPWFCLSLLADLITALPYEAPAAFLMSTEGQILYFLFFLMIIAVVGPALIQRFWGCRPLQEGYDRIRIENICKKAGLDYKEIMLWPLFGGKMMTAGVMGLVRRFRYILVTPALLRYLDPVEIDAVIAHEIGHVKQKHLVFYLFFFVGYLVIAFSMLDVIIYGLLYSEAAFGWIGGGGPGQSSTVSVVFSLAMIAMFFVYFRYIFGYFMRNFERQADIYVYSLLDSARPLISTLKKIADTSGQSPDKPNWHHFSISQRVDYLNRCESNPEWIARHHRKIRYSIAVYLLAIGIIAWGGYNLHFGTAGQTLSTGVFAKLVKQQIEQEPDNPELYLMLGDLYQSSRKHADAISAYQSALSLNPQSPRALNNLAWLFATAEEKPFYRPEKALALAQKAAEISRQSHILDTLAESYYVNGRYEKAVSVAKKALAGATDKHAYYRDQLEKFKKAARQDPPKP